MWYEDETPSGSEDIQTSSGISKFDAEGTIQNPSETVAHFGSTVAILRLQIKQKQKTKAGDV